MLKILMDIRCGSPKSMVSVSKRKMSDNVANQEKESLYSSCDPGARIVYTELGFLRAGHYEWQIMAVSLAGNGSWSKSHFFEVKVASSLQPCEQCKHLFVCERLTDHIVITC